MKVKKRKLESSICTQYKYILYSYKRIIQVYTVPTCKYTNCQLPCPSRGRHFTFFTIIFFVHKYHFMQPQTMQHNNFGKKYLFWYKSDFPFVSYISHFPSVHVGNTTLSHSLFTNVLPSRRVCFILIVNFIFILC